MERRKKEKTKMIVLLAIFLFLLIYYMGLVYVTKVAFKRKNINLSLGVNLFLPFFVLKTFAKVLKKNWYNKKTRKKVLIDIVFGYNMGLIILVEIVHFGFVKGMLVSDKKEKLSFMAKFANFRNSTMKKSFSDNMESQLVYA